MFLKKYTRIYDKIVRTMPRKKKEVKKEETAENSDALIIKRYGNRRLYNTETKSYVNYGDLAKIVRDGNDVRSC